MFPFGRATTFLWEIEGPSAIEAASGTLDKETRANGGDSRRFASQAPPSRSPSSGTPQFRYAGSFLEDVDGFPRRDPS
jgi:hypothetical protein